ncbi:beta-galactosidase [bacterium]|nr:beta-galactosidase [bacterium]
MKKFFIFFLFLISTNLLLLAQEVDYGPKHTSPTLEVVTPHIEWLKPYFKGPIKILFITHRGGMREVVELSERMDIDFTVFSVASPDAFYERDPANPSTLSPESMTAEGEAKLAKPYDVIVLGNINWSSLPLSIRYLILKKVKEEGTSLLGIFRGEDEYIKRAMTNKISPDFSFLYPFKALPYFEKFKDFNEFLNSTLDIYQFGNGRIFILKGYDVPYRLQCLTPPPVGNPIDVKYVEYDYYLAYICHLITIVSKKEQDVKIRGNDYLETDRESFTTIQFSIDSPSRRKVSCRFALRNKDNEVFFNQTKEISLTTGENRVSFVFHQVPAGEYFADLWVGAEGKTIAFGSSFIRVSSDIRISHMDIQSVYNKDDAISGKILLENKSGNWKGLFLWIAQRDNFGRITARKDIPLATMGNGETIEVPFTLPRTKPLTVLQWIDVVLSREERGIDLLDAKSKAFFVSDLYPKDDIRQILWVGAFGSYLTPHFYRELYKNGIDTQYTGFNEAILLGNLHHLPYATRFIDRKTDWYPHPDVPNRTKDDHIRLPCLNDPSYLEEVRENLTKTAEHLKQFSVREYSMGDECHFVGGSYELCFCPYCVQGFSKFLQKEYGGLDNLNKEYESDYKSFEDVKPITLEEAKKNPKLIPLWVDYRRYMEDVWAGIYRFSGDVIRRIVPNARVGYEGSDMSINSYIAADFYKLMQAMNLNNTYDAPFIPYAVSDFSQPGTLLGLGWYGGYNPCRSEIYNHYIPWRHLFRGANSYWLWHGEPGMEGSVIAPDLSFYDFFKANIEEVKELKRGIGKLIMTAKREGDIAVLYSASSVHLSTLTDGFPPMEQVLNNLITLLEDSKCQFRIISYEQLANGILEKEDFRILILPFVQALSYKEAEQIRQFVNKGGIAIADLRPGIYDQHGKPFEKAILDELFGVQQDTSPQPKMGNVLVKAGESFPQNLPNTVCDASLKVTKGEAKGELEGVPCLIINKFGNGTAILLNFSLTPYTTMGENSSLWISFMKSLLNTIGYKEKAVFSPDLPGLRTYWFKSGNLQYLGILQEPPAPFIDYALGKASKPLPAPVKLSFPKKYHIYDVREGKYIGYTNSFNTRIEACKAKLFALLPYKVNKITISIPSTVKQGGILNFDIKLSGSSPSLGTHIVHISLVSPKGEVIPYYEDNIAMMNGRIKGSISFALNEATGKWRLRVKDIASGVTSERTFQVESI